MSWLLWIVVAYLFASIILGIAQTGKPRERTTPGVVAVATVIVFGLIVLVVVGGGLLG